MRRLRVREHVPSRTSCRISCQACGLRIAAGCKRSMTLLERLPVEQLHRGKEHLPVAVQFVNVHDVAM